MGRAGQERRQGHRLAVDVQLVESRTARIVWADVLDHPFDDALLALDEIGNRIFATVEDLRPRAEAKGLALRLAIDDRLPAWVKADGDRWRQVLVNLLANAIKFTDRGSVSVWFRGEPEPDGRVRFTLAVCDTGPGVPERARAHLFQPFHGSTRQGGTGLGLAIAAEIVRAHGGEIGLVERAGAGAVFEVTIPDRPVNLSARRQSRGA